MSKHSFHIQHIHILSILMNTEHNKSILQLYKINASSLSITSIGSITFPIQTYSICVVNGVFIIGGEDYLFLISFDMDKDDNGDIVIRKGGQQQQFPNKSIYMSCLDYMKQEILIGDSIEGITYVKFKEMKNDLYAIEICGEDERNRRIKGFYLWKNNEEEKLF